MITGNVFLALAIGVFIYFLLEKGDADHDSQESDAGHFDEHRQGETNQTRADVLQDPVCGKGVHWKSAALTSEYLGRTFHFCSEQCRKIFDLHPTRYVRVGRE